MLRRAERSSLVKSRPSNQISPAAISPGGGTRPSTARLVTDFPDPDSPTIPSVRPEARSKLTRSTAGTARSRLRKRTCKSRTDKSVSVILGLLHPRIQCIPQTVSNKVEAEKHHCQNGGGRGQQNRVNRDRLRAFVRQHSERRCRRRNTQT